MQQINLSLIKTILLSYDIQKLFYPWNFYMHTALCFSTCVEVEIINQYKNKICLSCLYSNLPCVGIFIVVSVAQELDNGLKHKILTNIEYIQHITFCTNKSSMIRLFG